MSYEVAAISRKHKVISKYSEQTVMIESQKKRVSKCLHACVCVCERVKQRKNEYARSGVVSVDVT